MLSRYWTKTALDCYFINSQCSECKLADELETIPKDCKMKQTLQILIKKFGTPEIGEEFEDIQNLSCF